MLVGAGVGLTGVVDVAGASELHPASTISRVHASSLLVTVGYPLGADLVLQIVQPPGEPPQPFSDLGRYVPGIRPTGARGVRT
jgi:hypothetical protein